MGELERATMERRGSGSSTGSVTARGTEVSSRRLTEAASHDRLLGSSGSSVRRTPTSVLSAAPPPSTGSGAGGQAWPWPRHSSERNLHSSRLGASTSRASRPGSVEARDTSGEWEYKPHISGDPVDAAVAALVNRPGKRFKNWRALLCRLEHGVYLCGTHRMRLRIGTSTSRLEASEDNGDTWADLEETLRLTEAMQRSLLERVREAPRTAR